MKIVALLALVGIALAVHSEDEYRFLFSKWQQQHGKSYQSYEEGYRYAVFKLNLDKIEKYMQGNTGTVLEMNAFGDLSHEEFAARYLSHKFERRPKFSIPIYHPVGDDLPAEVDWLKDGAVTPVKDQGQCGSCYAFSAVGSMEGAWFMKNKKLVSLSESQIVDCSSTSKYGNEGCNGGQMYASIQYVIDNGGIDTEDSYKYQPTQRKCAYKASTIGATMTGMYNVTEKNEKDLADALAHKGPVAVAIDASSFAFQFYSTGIYAPTDCSETELDHGVTLTGYNADPTLSKDKQYWIIKNSWGTSWGRAGGHPGYMWLQMNHNRCGVATEATVAIA